MLTADTAAYLSGTAKRDFQNSLRRLGRLKQVELLDDELDFGMTFCVLRLRFSNGVARMSTYRMANGLFEELLLSSVR